jgi:chromosome segregation ATPase
VISLSDRADPERFVAEFSGTDRVIGEYLMAEMLERQPSEVQSMLLRTSLVDRLNGELADLLAGRSGSEQMLLELENANAAFAAENRRLTDRLDKLEKLRARYDQLVEVLKRREQKLLAEGQAARETLGALRLEVVEARNTISRSESLHGELQSALAARGNDAERFMREVEILREKNVSLSVELDLQDPPIGGEDDEDTPEYVTVEIWRKIPL